MRGRRVHEGAGDSEGHSPCDGKWGLTDVWMGVQSRLPDRTSFLYTSKDDSSAMCARSSSSSHVRSSGTSGSSQFCLRPKLR